MVSGGLSDAVHAFDSVAESFDARFGDWRSVSAQRDAVRTELVRAFPPGARILEIGGGTGEDAAWLAARGRSVLLTDPSPAMVRIAREKLRRYAAPPAVMLAAENLPRLAEEREAAGLAAFDGAFSNFAALNCVSDLAPVARGLARLLHPNARALLVLFGTASPGEVAVQLARGDAAAAFRRRSRGDVAARLGGHAFSVRYHRSRDLRRAMSPWFRLVARRGIGVFVPPSAAEPWISRHPRLLRAMAAADRAASRPLALLGDHILFELERTAAPPPAAGEERPT
jgi:SAM-dependent methyltransferase